MSQQAETLHRATPTFPLVLGWTAAGGGIAVLVAAVAGLPIVAIVAAVATIGVSIAALAAGAPVAGHGLAGLVTSVAGCLVAATITLTSATADVTPPPSGPSPPKAAPTPIALTPAEVAASATAARSTDGFGRPVSFDAVNVSDGDAGTAWRVPGSGRGQTLTFRFGRRVHLTAVGVIPGYAKTDPATGKDRFHQNRRVRTASLAFSDGSVIGVTFHDEPVMQSVNLDVDTDGMVLTVLTTTSRPERNYTAVSEVAFEGWPLG